MALRWISLGDLMLCEDAKEALLNNDTGAFYEQLHDAGWDINEPIEFEDVYCRSLLNSQVITLGRVVGEERTDDFWMSSPWCTFENRLEQAMLRDSLLGYEMKEMCRYYNFTGEIIRHLEDAWGSRNDQEDN